MATLTDIVDWCDRRVRRTEIADFPGAENGLQVTNDGTVSRIGAAVDADLATLTAAVEAGVDLLIVHHGLFWDPPVPMTGPTYRKFRTAFDGNLAVYGAHLPLDAHPEIGNNALLARELGLTAAAGFLPYEGTDIGLLADVPADGFAAVKARLQARFPDTFQAIEHGSKNPERVAVLTGSGIEAVTRLRDAGVDTLITGELKQHAWALAVERGLNLYPCGHYATETFGVKALAEEAAKAFDLPWSFIPSDCPL
ncbi:MAG: Nif3-like dinuclear metal center hexameric protein [Opitutales bacterium]